MVDTTFVPQVTHVVSTWANPVNKSVYQGVNPSYVASTGAANAYVVTLPASTMTALTNGQRIQFRASFTNTGAATLQLIGASSTTATNIVSGNASLVAGAITAGDVVDVTYDNSAWHLTAQMAPLNILDFLNTGGGQVTGDWNGSTGTNNKTGIQAALDSGRSLVIGKSAAGLGYYLGVANSGAFLTFKANGQCLYFQDGAYLVALGNATVSNSAVIISNEDSTTTYSGNWLYNPYFVSNVNVLTTDNRDAPYAFGLFCTHSSGYNYGVVGGKFYRCQVPVQISKSTFGDGKEVAGVYIDYVSDTCFYGFGCENTGNGVTGSITVIDAFRPFIVYGCTNHTVTVTNLNFNRLARTCQAEIGVGINNQATTDRSTIGLNYHFTTGGSTYSGGPKLIFSAQRATGNTGIMMRDVNVFFNDIGSTGVSSIGFDSFLDGVAETSVTGTVFDGITLSGSCTNPIDLTGQGARAALVQTVPGYANMQDLKVLINSALDDPNLGMFYGLPPHGYMTYVASLTARGSGTAGTATPATNILNYRHGNRVVEGQVDYSWTGLVGAATGNLLLGTGTLGSQFPASTLSGYSAIFPVASTTLTYAGQLWARISAGNAYFDILETSSGGALSPVAVQTAGSLVFDFRYFTDI